MAQVGISVVDQGIPSLTGSYAAGVAADRIGERAMIVAGGRLSPDFDSSGS